MTNKEKLIKSAEAVSLFNRLNINAKKNLPVRSSEMGLLILIVKADTPITPVMAADFFRVRKPMITAMVNTLTMHGYIVKVPSQEDRRSFTLSPTEKAVTLVEQTYMEYLKTLRLLQSQLGENDFDTFIHLLEKANSILLEDQDNG